VRELTGKVIAERLFYCSYNDTSQSIFIKQSSTFGKREEVRFKLNISDSHGSPTAGIFSVACVQQNRVLAKLSTDIVSYNYISSALNISPMLALGNNLNNKAIEDVLSVNSNRPEDVAKTNVSSINEGLTNWTSRGFTGSIKRYNKQLSKPVKITLFNDSSINIIETEPNGTFVLPTEDLVTQYGKTLSILINGSSNDGYNVSLNPPDLDIRGLEIDDFGLNDLMVNSSFVQSTTIADKAPIQLNEVIINPNEIILFMKISAVHTQAINVVITLRYAMG
jgi:hypothetical protein